MNILNYFFEKILRSKYYFKISYFIVTLLTVTLLNQLPFLSLINKVIIVWGVILIPICFFYDYYILKKKLKYHDIILFTFLLLTLTLNLTVYFSIENIKLWIVNCIFIIVFFSPTNFDYNPKKIFLELKNFSLIYFYISIIVSFSSLAINLFKIPIVINNEVFTSVFSNENSLGLFCGLSILITILLYNFNLSKTFKLLFIINLFLQTLTLLFGGRSSLILLISIIFIYLFIRFKSILFRITISILPIILASIDLFLNSKVLYLILSGRELLWSNAIETIKRNPLTGIGNSNMLNYFYELTANGYLPGIETGGLHNIYLQTGVVNGVFALLLFLFSLISIFLFTIKLVDNMNLQQKKFFIPLISIFVGLSLVGMVESINLYNMSFLAICFWTFTGYLLFFVNQSNIDIYK